MTMKYHVFFKKSGQSAPVEYNTDDPKIVLSYVQDFLKCSGAVIEVTSAEIETN